ncbi:MAG TPA: MEDS domain-containing protein [Bryobacteraceae bacterium]
MNSKGAAILANPHPCGHIVYPYTDETQVSEAVCLFASAGLRKGEAVILVMTSDHTQPIRRRLEQEGFNLRQLERAGQLICEDAKDLLSTFTFDGVIDERVFKTKLGKLIEAAKASGGNRTERAVRVFGEMVDLLWKSNLRTTQRLEELWNEVIDAHSVPLLCAYSLAGPKPRDLPAPLLACHSHAIA